MEDVGEAAAAGEDAVGGGDLGGSVGVVLGSEAGDALVGGFAGVAGGVGLLGGEGGLCGLGGGCGCEAGVGFCWWFARHGEWFGGRSFRYRWLSVCSLNGRQNWCYCSGMAHMMDYNEKPR